MTDVDQLKLRQFIADDLVWGSINSLNGRIYIEEPQMETMNDFPQFVDAAFIGAIAMLIIIAVLRLARNIARWLHGS